MQWKELISRKTEILINIANIKNIENMLNALQEDVEIDRYQDTQPGGGSCLINNYKKQEECQNKLDALYSVRSLFPGIKENDIPIVEYFIAEAEKISSNAPSFITNSEFMCGVTQGCDYFEYTDREDTEITKESIDAFSRIGSYIAKLATDYDENTETIYMKLPDDGLYVLNDNLESFLIEMERQHGIATLVHAKEADEELER